MRTGIAARRRPMILVIGRLAGSCGKAPLN